MIEGLDKLLQGHGQPCLAELRELLDNLEMSRGRTWRLLKQELLQPPGKRVFRLQFGCDGEVRSFVAKRLEPTVALRNELLARRWLPAIGSGRACPLLLGSAAARDGSCTWQLYEDLGRWEFELERPNRDRVRSAIELVARIHTRFGGHPLLGEVRLHGTTYGSHYLRTNVQDALGALEAVKPAADRREVCGRLLDRLRRLREELPERAGGLDELGGPDTLLHGDLWTINVFVSDNGGRLEARLIDWDHVGVGPVSYDLSTFLLRFPVRHRPWVLELYQQEVARAGWRLPGKQDLNVLFETTELARYANRIIWPAIAIAQDGEDWGFVELDDIETWFENLAPVLPEQDGVDAPQPLAR